MPERIQRRRAHGWRMPTGAVYVGRPTMWGNPFRAGEDLYGLWRELAYPVGGRAVRDAAHAVALYQVRARISIGFDLVARRDLRGSDLACWCPLDQPCHADVLLEVANATTTTGGTQ